MTTVTKALLDSPHLLLDAHQSLEIFDIFIRPISPYGFAKNKEDYTIDEYLAFYSKLLELVLEKISKEFHLSNILLQSTLKE